MTTMKTMVTPCIVKTWLYRSADSSWLPGTDSCRRMSSASTPPTRRKKNDATPYMMPIFL